MCTGNIVTSIAVSRPLEVAGIYTVALRAAFIRLFFLARAQFF